MAFRIILFLQLFHCLIISQSTLKSNPFVVILGNIQDAGSPHMGCKKSCCKNLFENPPLPLGLRTLRGALSFQKHEHPPR